MFLSLVVPAFNEAEKIAKDIEKAAEFLASQSYDSELIIVDDGSHDATFARAEVAAGLSTRPNVTIRVVKYGANRGKGYAIRYGMTQALGEVVGFMDSGMCVPLKYIDSALQKINGGADFAIASRRLPGTKIVKPQPLYRQVGSKAFWHVMRVVMGVRATDTQCGFKFYKRDVAQKIFSALVTDGFMFDIEALLVAKKMRLKGAEFPVEWSNDSDTRYRPIVGTIKNFKELARIRYRVLQAHGW